LWTVPTSSTTVCISLRRHEHTDLIKLRGLVRFGNHGRARVALRGVGELRGRQYAALVCSLPVPAPRRSVQDWVFGTSDAASGLTLPASGCGQLIGADEHGRAVALPLFGPEIGRVEMCATLHLAQQVVLRSLALGARIHVHTGRPAAWRAMAAHVGDQNLLRVDDHNPGSSHNYSIEMFDGTAEQPVQLGVTSMVVKPPHATPSRDADVTMQLLDRDHDVVRVATAGGSSVVTMVATDDEIRYLKTSLGELV
jgi:hypothetical protein